MEPAKVYFSDLRADEISTLEKLHRLMKAAGFEQIDFKDKYVAIKLHFGEPGNMAYPVSYTHLTLPTNSRV